MAQGSQGIDTAPVDDPQAKPARLGVGVAHMGPVILTMMAAAWNWLMAASVVAFPLATGVRDALATWLVVALGLTGLAIVHLRSRHVWSLAVSWAVAGAAVFIGAAASFGWINLPI
jgi:hypothetical protein